MEVEKNLKDAGHTLNVENSIEDNKIGEMLISLFCLMF